ncbi:protein of unknown function [Algoriphagus locisalis]|uniref:DUF4221 domain-containing protein n=1 Tax=Algoriphagus locisalis TaxID=305507 RepID=A0A1I6YA36_9BACT|nr:DUF4221 family protein [Algoriphagus locisalis]SFT47034.1 protein of unknown function [Algoriphagus locisalis]
MKSAFLNLTLAILFSLIYACSPSKESAEKSLVDFQVEALTIPIGPEVDPYTKTMQYFAGGLYWHNENRSSISKIDLANKTIEEVIKYDYEGPRGVGSTSGFHFIHKDTIIIPSAGPVLYILPIASEEIQRLDLSKFNENYTHTISLTRNSKPMYSLGSNLILNQQFNYRTPSEVTEESLSNFFPFITIDYYGNKSHKIPFNFTIESFDNKLNDPTYKVAYNENFLYTMTSYSNRLYKINLEDYSTQEFDLHTNLIPKFTNNYFTKEDKLSRSLDINMELYLSEPQNFGLLKDPYKKLLYRMTWPGSGVPEGISPMKFVITPSHFILSVYDENFELKYEFELPEYEYIPHQYFVSEAGLHLFGNHPDHPDSKEDQLVIHTFDFSD